ncbi:hypothetical protein CDD82_6231 [Ophiocordyceps australis]|uniref:Uncharacterized protein n=1 Tax=Ophiocordyceps australis TaxID=1399860 RepID=A0A2C5YY66_9HYPO|nr:hypothetical protein CDD82_6231 [Ophiocordyceps australis]
MPTEKHDNESSVESEIYISSDTASEKRPGSKRDGDTGRLDRPWRRAQKDTRSPSATTRSAEDHDVAGSHNDTKSKAPEKHCSDQDSSAGKNESAHEAPKLELLEAPIPSVNIWQQRREAMAKLKPTTTGGDGGVNGASASFADARKTVKSSRDSSLPMSETASTNGSKQPRKASETVHTERNGSQHARTTEKETRDIKADLPPSVDDAASWPTPETAVKEKRKSSISNADRAEKDAKDNSEEPLQHKSRQKEKWITYDYVPSVNFETQLPQMRGMKPRGVARAANGTSRATGTTQVNEKAAAAVPVAKSTENRDRPREGVPAPNRTASVPPAVKRTSMDVSSFRDQRRASGHASGHAASDRSKDATTSYSTQLVSLWDESWRIFHDC